MVVLKSYRAGPIRAHRTIKALELGRWPEHEVDHENQNRAVNQIPNLREATHAQNTQNRGLLANNTSGVKGVYRNKNSSKCEAGIDADGRHFNLGRFDTFEEARDVRLAAEIALHPFRPKPPPVDPMTIIPDGAFVTGCWSIDGKTRRVRKLKKPIAMTTSTVVFTYETVTK